MTYPDESTNRETDARTNAVVPPVEFAIQTPSDLVKLRSIWAQMPSTPRLLLSRDQGEKCGWPGFDVRTLLRGEQSSGRWSFNSLLIAPGTELPAHAHEVTDTYWYIVDGEVELTIGSETKRVVGPAFGFALNQTTQAVANHSSKPVEVFVGYSPAGVDRAFAAAHRLWQEQPTARSDAYLAVLAAHGFQFTGGRPQPNDARTNQAVPRVDADVQQYDDYLNLRKRWAQLPGAPKLVTDPRACLNIPVTDQETRVMLSPEESRGGASAFLGGIDKGFGAPAHHQPSEEEFFIVVQGPLNLRIGNQTVEAAPRGAFGFAPRFGTHAFNNMVDHRVYLFTMNSPGGHDRGFEMTVRELGTPTFMERIAHYGFHFHPPA
jgi:mannose-6-phosphate isomerase-like protein (cupin superfamily)